MPLALGTVQFGLIYGAAHSGPRPSLDQISEILDAARAHGVRCLDTAIGYGDAEARLGQCGVRDFDVVTKIPPLPLGMSDPSSWVFEQIEAALDRLKKDSLYAVLIHRTSDLFGSQGDAIARGISELMAQGLTQRVGVSVYRPDELETAQQLLPLGLVQCPANVIDQRILNSPVVHCLNLQGVEIHARSAYLQGILLQTPNQRNAYFDRFSTALGRWDNYLRDTGMPASHVALGYIAGHPLVDAAVVGVQSKEQFEEAIVAAGNVFTDPAIADLACMDEDLIDPSRWSLA